MGIEAFGFSDSDPDDEPVFPLVEDDDSSAGEDQDMDIPDDIPGDVIPPPPFAVAADEDEVEAAEDATDKPPETPAPTQPPAKKAEVIAESLLLPGWFEDKNGVSAPAFSSDGVKWKALQWHALVITNLDLAEKKLVLPLKGMRIVIKGERLEKVFFSFQTHSLVRISPSPRSQRTDASRPFIDTLEFEEVDEDKKSDDKNEEE